MSFVRSSRRNPMHFGGLVVVNFSHDVGSSYTLPTALAAREFRWEITLHVATSRAKPVLHSVLSVNWIN
jgi:hypothetical protein